jgi:tRNA wybutosine-synthesizing protein 3
MGLALESLVGFHHGGRELCNVSEEALRTLLEIANERFRFNTARIAKFRELLIQSTSPDAGPKRKGDGVDWEDAQERKERKQLEGLRRKEMLKDGGDPLVDPEDIAGLEFFQ